MRLVTYATQSERFFPVLMMSCKRHGHHIEVLGWGSKWEGWVARMRHILSFASSLQPDEIVCFIDAYDVIMLRGPAELEQAFLSTGCSLLISADVSTLMNRWIAGIRFGSCNDMSLNAGTYIGRAESIVRMLSRMTTYADAQLSEDDQRLMTLFCRDDPSSVRIDVERRVFYVCMFDIILQKSRDVISVSKASASLSVTTPSGRSSQPCILHCPANSNMFPIAAALGYILDSSTQALVTRQIQWDDASRTLRRMEAVCVPIYILAFALLVVMFASSSTVKNLQS